MHSAFDGLLPIFTELAPELKRLSWPTEERATCSRCAMAEPGACPGGTPRFAPDLKCCTFHPFLPNYSVGAALNEGGDGAKRVVARMLDRQEGIRLDGIDAGAAWYAKYAERAPTDFGTRRELLCPYWVGGEDSCGIWSHRNGVCRTWFCRFEDGRTGYEQWAAARSVLGEIELALARWCVEQAGNVRPPTSVRHWIGWYLWCAQRASEATVADLCDLDEALRCARSEMRELDRQRGRPLEEVVIPTVQVFERRGSVAYVGGYSTYDLLEVPASVLFFFSLLDGTRTWREACDLSRAECPWLSAEWVEAMWRLGVLGSLLEG